MQTDPDTTRIVRSWLEDGATALPDRVLDTVLDHLPATPQRRASWPARRLTDMSYPIRIAVAAAAVAVVAVAAIGITAMPRAASVGGSAPTLTPTLVPTPLPTPTAAPSTPVPTSSPALRGATPTASATEVVLGFPSASHTGPAGRYSWDPDSGDWQGGLHGHGWMHKGASHVEVTFDKSDNTYGPGPTAVTVGGYDATYQELLVNSKDVLKRYVWIVDIDGTPVTIAVASGPGASAADFAEAKAVIDSIRLERTKTKTGFKLDFDLLAGWDSG